MGFYEENFKVAAFSYCLCSIALKSTDVKLSNSTRRCWTSRLTTCSGSTRMCSGRGTSTTSRRSTSATAGTVVQYSAVQYSTVHYLRHCSIHVVVGRCFEDITNLVELDLSYNLLQIIPKVTRMTMMITMMMMMMMMIRRR